MTEATLQTVIDGLDLLLKEERAALMSGDLEAVAPLMRRKEALLDALQGEASAEGAELAALRARAAHNRELLEGALEGLRNVAGRLAAFRRIRRSLETYDSHGRRMTISGDVVPDVEKRA